MNVSSWLVVLSLGLWLAPACDRYVSVGHLDALTASGSGGTVAAGADGGAAGGGGDAGAAGASGEADAAGASGANSDAPTLPWAADHETGDFEQWLSDGTGRRFEQGGGELEISEQHAHSGSRAVRATISATDGELHQAVMGRDLQLTEGRYSAWYYLPEPIQSRAAVIMKLSNGPVVDRYDIDLEALDGDPPRLRIYEHASGDFITEPSPIVFPIAQWVHVEALYRSTPESNGRLVLFQDGQQILDSGSRVTADDAQVVFYCGLTSRSLTPAPFSLFVDDASIEAAAVP